MRVAHRPGRVWTMQRMPGAGRADRAPFGGTATTGLLRLAERDVYVTLRRTVRTLPSGRGRVRHAWIARTPATYPTGAGRTGTPSPESPYVPRRFRSGRRGLGADDAFVGAPANTASKAVVNFLLPVANQESELSGVVAELHEQVAGLLGDPVPGGVGSVVVDMYAAVPCSGPVRDIGQQPRPSMRHHALTIGRLR
jgi:hypothetical protein